MILPTTNFKARLISIPKVPKEEGSEEMVEFGKFTLNKKYRVYSIYSTAEVTQFMVADDVGIFTWLDISVFKK